MLVSQVRELEFGVTTMRLGDRESDGVKKAADAGKD